MQLSHSFTVPAPIDVAWATFMDLQKVGGCFPGATVTEVNDDSFSGTVKVKLGPIALVYAGSGRFLEKDDAAHRAVIEAKGKDKRGNGTAGATVTIELSEGGGVTRADVSTELAVTGKPAQFGRGVMQDVSDKLLAAFIACIEHQFAHGTGDSGDSGGVPTPKEAMPATLADAAVDEPVHPEPETPQTETPQTETPEPVKPEPETPQTGASVPTGAEPMAEVPAAAPVTASPAHRVDDAIDLGSVAGPVLAQRYAGYAAAGVAGLVAGWALGRRGRRNRGA